MHKCLMNADVTYVGIYVNCVFHQEKNLLAMQGGVHNPNVF